MAANPSLAHFSFHHVLSDSAMLLMSTDLAVMVGCFAAAWLVIKPLGSSVWRLRFSDEHRPLLAPLVFFFAFLGMIVLAYLTGTQPIIFPRYGLILFTLGIPILAWTVLTLIKQRPEWKRRLLISVVAICVLNASVQLVAFVGSLNQMSVQRSVADYLRDHYQTENGTRILCDEGTVSVMSGIAPEAFLSFAGAPKDREGFLNFLKEKKVEYVVFVANQDSTLRKLFPDLEYGANYGVFEPVAHNRSEFMYMNVWVYRVRVGAAARP
jgi:hypothetical protein